MPLVSLISNWIELTQANVERILRWLQNIIQSTSSSMACLGVENFLPYITN